MEPWGGATHGEVAIDLAEPVILIGTVVTMDPELPHAEAFAMREGRIIAVGSLADVRASVAAGTREEQIVGVIVPGLIDSHMHMQRGGLKALDLFPDGVEIDEFMVAMRETMSGPVWTAGEPSIDERVEGMRRIQPLLHSLGITGIVDPAVTIDELRGYQETKRRGALTMRSVAMPYPEIGTESMPTVDEAITHLTGIGVSTGFGDDMLRLGPIKVYYDGEGMKGEALLEVPWDEDDDDCFTGTQRIPTADFVRLVEFCAANGWGVGVHAVGGKAVAEATAAFAAAAERSPIDHLRFQLIHAYLEPDTETIELAAKAGVIASLQPSIAWNNLGGLIDRLGERAAGVNPVRTWIDAGATVAFGSDGPFFPFDPRLLMWQAITRKAKGTDTPVSPELAITVREAFEAYTVAGAYASLAEDRRGMLRTGMLADFAVFDIDPSTAAPDALLAASVLRTVVGGRTVYERP